MAITLDHLLQLSGRLDETPSYDAPRQRFRRFLFEQSQDLDLIQALLDEARPAPDDQHRRAFQDLVVVLGRTIGCDVTFGNYLAADATPEPHGVWRAALQQVVIEVRRDSPADADASGIRNWIATKQAASESRTSGLIVVASIAPGRHRLEAMITDGRSRGWPAISVVSVQALVTAVTLVLGGRLTVADLLRLVDAHVSLDFIVDLLAKPVAAAPVVEAPPPRTNIVVPESTVPELPAAVSSAEARYWIATVAPDHATSPEQFLEIVVSRRRLLGVNDPGGSVPQARLGDSVAFYISRRGVVGRARIEKVERNGSGLRDAHRFRHVLHLDEVELHVNDPVALDAETELHLRTAPAAANRHAHTLVEISSESFAALGSGLQPGATPEQAGGEIVRVAGSETPAEPPVSAEDLRSRASALRS